MLLSVPLGQHALERTTEVYIASILFGQQRERGKYTLLSVLLGLINSAWATRF